ncbi:hypothetical protein BDZ97DRAFT_2044009 [Flammula alnicola]|nr:hypothetical protein BDZ97DRAFT_2044009 [Flammula alnicola]
MVLSVDIRRSKYEVVIKVLALEVTGQAESRQDSGKQAPTQTYLQGQFQLAFSTRQICFCQRTLQIISHILCPNLTMNFMLANSDTLELHPNDPRRSDFYYDPAPASIQHKRFVALRQLISSDIPCILWGPDAMYYSRFFPAIPCDQQILVPDDLVESAATLLEQKEFRRVQMSRFSMENPFDEANPGAAAFPDAIRLQHADISDSTGPYGRSPLPGCVLLIPQSYYDVDFRSTSRFQLLDEEVIQLDALNGKILVPKFHTFLEAVVYIIFNPPTGFQHQTSLSEHEIWLERILRYRVKEDPDLETNPNRRTRKSDLRPAECEIIAEIQNADCAWYIHKYLWEISFPIDKDVDEYKQHK